MHSLTGFLVYALDRNPRGTGQYTRRLLQGLRQVGQLPWVLLAGGGPGGNNVIPLRGAGLLPGLMTIGQAEIGWYARQYRLDLVHDPIGTAPLAFCTAKRVVTLHDVFPLSFPGFSTALDTLIYRTWLPWIVPNLDAVITVSQCSRSDICEYLKVSEEKIEVIHEAAGPRFLPLKEAEISPVLARYNLARPYILYVGSVEPRKNLLRLLEAYTVLRQWSAKCRLVIVGARNYWKSSPVASAVAQRGLQDSVIITGYIPDEDLPAIYNGADLFCFPSLYEGFGLPVLEAMACGTPVVTSNTSSLPEVAGDAALLVDPYSVDEITKAMRSVLGDAALAQELHEKGLERARQFSWEKTARETIAVYEKVLGEKLE